MRLFGASVVVATCLLAGSAGVVLAQSEESPVPSLVAEEIAPQAAELVALFPEQLGGQPLREAVTVLVGEEHLEDLDPNDPEDAQGIQSFEVLAQAMGGATVADLVSASAQVDTEDGGFALVGAFRVAGVDATQTVDPVLAWAESDLTESRSEASTFADRDVTLLYLDGTPDNPPAYLYASGDTVWVVLASEPLLTEVFEQLP